MFLQQWKTVAHESLLYQDIFQRIKLFLKCFFHFYCAFIKIFKIYMYVLLEPANHLEAQKWVKHAKQLTIWPF